MRGEVSVAERARVSQVEAVTQRGRRGWAAVARYRSGWFAAAVLLAGLVALLAIARGSVEVPLDRVLRILVGQLPGVTVVPDWTASQAAIILQIRLPRVVIAGLVGATLALAGATYQGLFRNPLADPYLIGVASGAGFGATVVLTTPLAGLFYAFGILPLAAFLGALAAVALAYLLARVGNTVPVTGLILAGVAIAALASAGTSYLMLSSKQDIRIVLSWLLGGFSSATWDRVPQILPYLAIGAAVILAHARTLNVFQLDEEQAAQLGVPVERTKLLLIAAASLATAAAISVTGLIGFAGLIVPHITRLLWGPDHRFLLPMSMVLGATYLIGADLVARTLIAPAEVPVGVITALCGAPFFLFILRRRSTALA
jgi:iron complex transport system permease protein